MMILSILATVVLLGALFYHRVSLFISSLILLAWTAALGVAGLWSAWVLVPLAIILVPFNFAPMRKSMISAPVFRGFRKVMPPMSRTEKEAIDAGTTWWEGDLFQGKPDWKKLHNYPQPRLTAEEQAFLDGPVEEACRMANDFQITHELADLPPELWAYLKEHRFFAMIIKKEYGGLEFSAYAQSRVLQKLSGVSGILAITVGVPNSLGPGELLQHYGTDEQKDHYLPRLARGQEIPCFALTSPEAGSDAGAIPDTGIVCMGEWQGQQVLGMRLTWNKRYITLAPIATVLGLAFKLSDPEKLLGGAEDLGITCALIPTTTPGVEIGRRHFPLNVPFQNGPTRGKDVFVPIDYIIGGPKMAGQGWRMLVECLSVGRGITLPSNSTGGVKSVALATGAYAHIRRQFKISIGKMEGIEEPLARIAGNAYVMDAAASLITYGIMLGEKPAVLSAIVKYHCTHRGQQSIIDAMDMLYTSELEGFCLVSSDSDFTKLASRLRESGKTVIGMGEGKTPSPFRKACDIFTELELLLEDNTMGKEERNTHSHASGKWQKKDNHDSMVSKEKIEEAVVKIITENQNNDRETGLGEVGSRLVKLYPDFDVRRYGYSLLSKFLESLPKLMLMQEGTKVTVTIYEDKSRKEMLEEYILLQIQSAGGYGIPLSSLGNRIRMRFGDFKVRDYGFSQFKQYIASFPDVEFVDDEERTRAVYMEE